MTEDDLQQQVLRDLIAPHGDKNIVSFEFFRVMRHANHRLSAIPLDSFRNLTTTEFQTAFRKWRAKSDSLQFCQLESEIAVPRETNIPKPDNTVQIVEPSQRTNGRQVDKELEETIDKSEEIDARNAGLKMAESCENYLGMSIYDSHCTIADRIRYIAYLQVQVTLCQELNARNKIKKLDNLKKAIVEEGERNKLKKNTPRLSDVGTFDTRTGVKYSEDERTEKQEKLIRKIKGGKDTEMKRLLEMVVRLDLPIKGYLGLDKKKLKEAIRIAMKKKEEE